MQPTLLESAFFADIIAYPPHLYPGLIVLRVTNQRKPHVLAVFSRILPLLKPEEIQGHLWIVEESRVRIR